MLKKIKRDIKNWDYDSCKAEALKYKTKSEFKDNAAGARSYARKHGFFDEITSHMVKIIPSKWTYELCKEKSLECDTIEIYRKKYRRGAEIATENNWIIEFYTEEAFVNTRGFWSYEKCLTEALKYKHKRDFTKYSVAAASCARRNGWFDEITSHMTRPEPIPFKWTYEKCKEVIEKCKTYKELREISEGLLKTCKANGWFEKEIDSLRTVAKTGQYTREYVEPLLKGYILMKEFKKDYIKVYRTCYKFDWFKDITSHLINNGDTNKRGVYCYEIEHKSKKYVYVGLTYFFEERHINHNKSWNNTKNTSAVCKFCKENNLSLPEMKILQDYTTKEEAANQEGMWVEKYKEMGWHILNRIKTGGLGGNVNYIAPNNKEDCIERIKKHNTIRNIWQTESTLMKYCNLFDVNVRDYIVDRHNKQVEIFDLNGVFIKNAFTITEAAEFIGVTVAHIRNCLNGGKYKRNRKGEKTTWVEINHVGNYTIKRKII